MSQTQYKYCPLCATPLTMRIVYGHVRPACPACTFVQYPDPKVAVIAMVTTEERVLLIQRAIDPARGLWTLPGGYMDAGEMPEAALQRELMEEVSLPVRVGQLLEIFPMVVGARRSQGIVLAYHAQPAEAGLTALTCQDDACAAGWFLPEEIPSDLAFASTTELLGRWQRGWRPTEKSSGQ
ncbi:MAG TPA: NUDIX hydrolase [Caldilineaceae bacterium]|nr:NUDIX hydrolase [Caldilineaceae bacterium]